MAGKPQTRVVPGAGDRIAALLRQHASVNTAVALARVANLSRQTLHRAINEDALTQETLRAIASALGVSAEVIVEPGPQWDASYTREDGTVVGIQAKSYAARHARNLPLSVREFLAEAQLEMVKAGALDEEIAEALSLMKAPEVFTFYEGGAAAAREFNEADVLKGMRALYNGVIKPELKQRGRKL